MTTKTDYLNDRIQMAIEDIFHDEIRDEKVAKALDLVVADFIRDFDTALEMALEDRMNRESDEMLKPDFDDDSSEEWARDQDFLNKHQL